MLLPGKTLELERPVAADQLRLYAEASGDRNPIHLDDAFARKVGLPGVILHGLCTMSFVAQHAALAYGDASRLRKLKLKFSEPVFPGDTLRLSANFGDENDVVVRYKLACANQRGDDVVGNAQAEFSKLDPLPPLSALPYGGETYPPEAFTVTQEGIRRYARAVGESNPLFLEGLFAPPLFAAVYAMQPFLKVFLSKKDELEKGLRVIHASQDFEFARLIRPGEEIRTEGGIERKATRGGNEFLYFLTHSYDSAKNLVVLGRWLAIFSPAAAT